MTAAAAIRATGSTQRQRIIAAAAELTARSGWANVTMARLADLVGVSRQTVYNEIGSKRALAEAMVLDELDRFLAVVERAFDQHPEDLMAAIRAAVRGVLEFARDNTLLHAIVSATHGANTELLPLLTTDVSALLDTAKAVLLRRVRPYSPPLDERRLPAAVEVMVRVVLSHVMQPSGTPARTADDLGWIVSRVFGVDA